MKRSPRSTSTFRLHMLATAVALALTGMTAQAQLSTATVKGQITAGATAAQAGLAVTAVNKANGQTWRTSTRADGSYVLGGLAPGVYEIRISGANGATRTEEITVQVGETATVDLAVGAQLERVEIVGSSNRQGVRDAAVGTQVSRKMIENLPQVTRNFLSAADLAPGVAFATTSAGDTRIQSGSQNFDHVNVFIDGVGQKNNILRGGLTGQDTSRGNPFPQSAIAEYKVLTQNYKAEFDQVSSAAITAVTKSGTNEFHGDAYVDRTGTNWTAKSPFQKEKEAQGVNLPPSSKNEYGFSVGGPIVLDKVHFFVGYDGKRIEDSRQIVADHLDMLPAGAGIVPTLTASQGSQVDAFKEHLLFGKVDAQLNDDQKLTVSLRLRREDDRRPESQTLSMPGNDKNRSNDETHFDAKHEWTINDWLSEARIGYEKARWNPHSAATTPFIKYLASTTNLISNTQEVLYTGGSPDAQDRAQKGWFLSEDLSYNGLAGHSLKGGVKAKFMQYDLSGTANSVDTVKVVVDNTTGLPYYDGVNCTGTNVASNGNSSDQCQITRAIAPVSVSYKNSQIGLYLQDDWTVTKQLEVNLGMRWDYETNMLNNDYVTPADRVNALYALDGRTVGGVTAPAGQTYAQSLAKGGINIGDYIANGSSRKSYKGAIAPRLGFSWDALGDRSTVVFGGWGRSYDRTMANHALDELQKNKQQVNGEIWLMRNDMKMPYADQFTLGLRQAMGPSWNGEVAYSSVHAKNQFIWFGGNRDPNGGYGTQSILDPLWGGPTGYGTLILGDTVGETKTNALLLKAEKPYTKSSGWGFNLAYTYSDAKTTNKEWTNDIFDWTYGRSVGRGWNPSTLVDKHRVVAASVIDGLLPWGLTGSVKATWASGMPRRITDCSAGWSNCVYREGDAPSYRQVDIGAGKEVAFGTQRFGVRMDILNVFNTVNYGGFDDWGGGPVGAGGTANYLGGDNLNLGKPNSIRGDTRTVRMMLTYKF